MTEGRALAAILLTGLALRIGVLIALPDQSFPDAGTYMTAARDLLRTGTIEAHNVMPLYPALIALTGVEPLGIRALDIILSVASIWLMHGLTARITGDRKAALIAAAITAVYPHFLFYATSGLTETSYVFLLLLAFRLFYDGRMAAGSVVLVLSLLERPALELLAPLLVVAFARFVHRRAWHQAARHLATYAAIYVLLMSPWWMHNMAKYGQFVRLNLGDGLVLFTGNNPMNRSGGGIGGVDVDFSRFDGIVDPIARNAALKQAAIAHIAENPARFVDMAVVKFGRFWRLWPYAPEYLNAATVVVSLLSYAPVLLLAIGYAALYGARNWRLVLPPAMLIGYLTLVHLVTIASIRYRLPLEPFLIAFAAGLIAPRLPTWRANEKAMAGES
jgi:4-amino-4-deoxy-L-arabinose transferase-like glycosyltransferase